MMKAIQFISLLLVPVLVSAVETITSEEFYEGIQSGRFDLFIDVRTQAEWDQGHIDGAFFMNSLNAFGGPNQISTPSDLAGCEECTIVVYCRTGGRAGVAASILEANGFTGQIYNGLGVTQWTNAGYELVNTESVTPYCVDNPGQCREPIIMLTVEEFYDGIQNGQFDVIVDVRTLSEWNSGHIEGATFVQSLNAYGTPSQVSSPADLSGCEDCTLAVYCGSGVRAMTAAEILAEAGFKTPIYNGLGVSQWTNAGYGLVNTPSLVPPCVMESGQCSAPPTSSPTDVLIESLTSEEFYLGTLTGRWDIIIDVRTLDEWNSGHIENATLLESLQLYGSSGQISSPGDINGCMTCTIVVYCQSGNRAGQAAQLLVQAGFETPIYNGLGVLQWTSAGYDLVTSDSAVAPCVDEMAGTCSPVTPTAAPTVIDIGFCFSGDTIVQVENQGEMKMSDLRIGDRVMVEAGKYERVYSFGHRDENRNVEMLRILPNQLELSKDHLVFVEGRGPIPASMIKIGDVLVNGVVVEGIRTVIGAGVYAPYTPSGTIVVNDVLASNYIAFEDCSHLKIGSIEIPLSYHRLGQLAQTFHRFWCHWLGMDDDLNERGLSPWSEMALKGFVWVLDQDDVVKGMILAPTILMVSICAGIEALFMYIGSVDVVVVVVLMTTLVLGLSMYPSNHGMK